MFYLTRPASFYPMKSTRLWSVFVASTFNVTPCFLSIKVGENKATNPETYLIKSEAPQE